MENEGGVVVGKALAGCGGQYREREGGNTNNSVYLKLHIICVYINVYMYIYEVMAFSSFKVDAIYSHQFKPLGLKC